MASWREIDRIRKDASAVRDIAKRLLRLPNVESTDWEVDFLTGMATHAGEDGDLTTRQAEKLLQIRDDAEFISEFLGFSIGLLLQQCYNARLDLSEPDEEWIVRLFERNNRSIRRKDVGRLMRCARELNIVEEEVAA